MASRRLRPADWTWLSIPAIVFTHNGIAVLCGRQQLSERMDDYRKARPILTDAVIVLTALHLLRRLPPEVDPIHWLFGAMEHAKLSVMR